MTRIVQFQTNFSSGEIDPLLRARTDLAQYSNAMETATNVYVQPQGGVRRRDGLKLIHDFSNTYSVFKLIPFQFSTDVRYILVAVPGTIFVFRDGVYKTSFSVPNLTASTIPSMRYTQALDSLILVQEDFQPYLIVRNSDVSWSVTQIATNQPKYGYSVTSTVGSSVGTHGVIEVTAASGNFLFIAKVTSGGSNANIFTNASSYYEGQYIDVYPLGRLRIIRKQTDYSLKVYAEAPLFNTDEIAPGDWALETGYEDTWSATRGWPRTAEFHENRLYFGGSKSRPNTVWGSRIGDFYNFDPGTGLDDEGLEATINTSQLNSIIELNSGPDLHIFTTGGEFIIDQAQGEPVTPANIMVKNQSRYGIREDVPIANIGGSTVFVQRSGKSLMSFEFSDTTASYQATPISILSSHLVNTPVDMAVRHSTSTDETDRVYLVNSDGDMTVYSILSQQNVIAASKFTTSNGSGSGNGSFKAVAVDLTEAYVLVTRVEGGITKYSLEMFDEDVLVDCAYIGGAASGVTAGRLEGSTVQIVRDGIVEPTQVVPAGGSVTFASPATSSYQVGLGFDVEIKTMPAEPRLAQGTVQGVQKRIIQADILVDSTQNMVINGQEVPFRNFGIGVLDEAVQEFTGLKTVHGLLGYGKDGQITITQSAPLKMNLLGIEYRMSVGD